MIESTSYAVSWSDADVRIVGYARLTPNGLRLAGGGAGGRERTRTLRYADLTSIDIVRVAAHREIALRVGGELLMVSSLDRPGSLGELAERLRKLTDRSTPEA